MAYIAACCILLLAGCGALSKSKLAALYGKDPQPVNKQNPISQEEAERLFRKNTEIYLRHADYLEEVRRLERSVRTVPNPLKMIAQRVLFEIRKTTPGLINYFPISEVGDIKDIVDKKGKVYHGGMIEKKEEEWSKWQTGGYLVLGSDEVFLTPPAKYTLDPLDYAADIKFQANTTLLQLTLVDRENHKHLDGGPESPRRFTRNQAGLFFRIVPPFTIFGNPVRIGVQGGVDDHFNGVVSGVIEVQFAPPTSK